MTSTAVTPPATGRTRRGVDTWCLAVAAVLVASGAFHLLVFALDDRPWAGPVSWRKPFTFGEAFGVTLATAAWVSRPLAISARWRAVLLGVFAVDSVVEVAGITLQAWRHVPSHLNTSTAFDAAVAAVLAAGGAVLVAVLGTFAVIALTRPVGANPDRALAIRAGWLFLVTGLLSGAAMIAVGTVAKRTGTLAHAYAVTGFLKGFHGLTIHALLTLPALAWVLERLHVTPARRFRAVAGAVALIAAAAAVLLAVEIEGV